MRVRKSTSLMIMAIIICILMMTGQVIAGRKIVPLGEQPRTPDFSKAVPNQLNYQGFLADAADSTAVTDVLEMTFRLFDSESKGAELWSETHPAVEVGNGLFHVRLGSVTPFPAGLFDGTAMWLQTEAGAEVFAPRKPLVSVAYSHRSNSAEKLLDLTLMDLDDRWVNEDQASSVTSAMINDGEIIDDDVAPGAGINPDKVAGTAWTANNDGAGSGLDADMVDGQHAADFIGAADLDHLDAADGDPADAVYVDNNGNVGIGTTSPTAPLTIQTISGADVQFATSGNNADMVAPVQFNLGTSGPFNLHLMTNNQNRLAITGTGDVGIGTTTPGTELEVNGAVTATTYWGDGSNLTGIAGAPDTDWTIAGSDMYSGVTGNVGIGTASPGYPLHVYRYAGYSPAYAGYFHAVGHEATGEAYAVYANAQADDENAYGIYSTATSTWGQAYAGYFEGNVKADSIFLGSSSKAGQNGGLLLYNDGFTTPIVELGKHSNVGGKLTLRDTSGGWHNRLEPDVDGSGGFLAVYRNGSSEGFMVNGNNSGTEEPWVWINGSARSVDFFMGRSGDSSVVLPNSAVSAGEIKDEPGVSNSLGLSFYHLDNGNIDYAVDTVAITIPGPGYVEVTGGCYLNLEHSSGTGTRVFVNIDKTPAYAGYTLPGAQTASVPASIGTSLWQMPCTTTRLYEETSAGAKIYYLNVDYQSGTSVITNVARIYTRAKYYPTLYGSVTVTESDGAGDMTLLDSGDGDGTQPAPEPARRSITVEDHNARLEAEMAVLRAELQSLKEEVQNQRRH